MSYRGLVIGLAAAVLAASAPAYAEAPTGPDAVLQRLVDEALARNPRLVAAQQLERAAASRPVQAGSRPGPTPPETRPTCPSFRIQGQLTSYG